VHPGEAKIRSQFMMLRIAPTRHAAAIGDGSGALCEVGIGSNEHAALACRENFAVLKTEGSGETETSRSFALVLRAVRMSGILEQYQIALAAKREQLWHIAHRAAEMNRNHGFGLLRDRFAHATRIDVVGIGFDVDEFRGYGGNLLAMLFPVLSLPAAYAM